MGAGASVTEIGFPALVTLSPPSSCQKASHMPGECLRALGSWVASSLGLWTYFYMALGAHTFQNQGGMRSKQPTGPLEFKTKWRVQDQDWPEASPASCSSDIRRHCLCFWPVFSFKDGSNLHLCLLPLGSLSVQDCHWLPIYLSILLSTQ